MIFSGMQNSSAGMIFHSLCSDIFRRYVAGFILKRSARLHTSSHCSCVKRTCLRFVRFVKITLLIFLSNIGVLGAAAPNKPTAEPVGKKVYFFCTCDNQANPSVNTIQAMRLLPAKQACCNLLNNADISVILKYRKQLIQPFCKIVV